MATVAEIQQDIQRLQTEVAAYQSRIAALREDIDRARPAARPRLVQALGAQEQGLRDLNNQILALQRDLAAAQAAQPAPPPARSAGQAVQADQQGGPLETTSPPSNIPPGYRGAVTNADGEVVAYIGADGEWEYVGGDAAEQAGVPTASVATNTTASDDAGDQGESTDPEVQQQLQQEGAKSLEEKAGIYIFPQPNILDNFASYTYSISLYVMTDVQFASYIRAPAKNINSYLMLLQSAGAPKYQGGPRADQGSVQNLRETAGRPAAGRNFYFDNDYYLDNIELKTLATPQRGHGGMEIRFQVIETENITFLDNLHRVVQDLNKSKGVENLNFAKIFWLMVIRFYGYDENGMPIQIKGSNASDPQAAIEKYYPFQVKQVGFKIQGKDVVYDIVGAPLAQQTALSSALATIPADIELSGQTVGDILTGVVAFTDTTAPDTNPAATTTSQPAASTGDAQNDRELNRAASQAPPKATAAKSTTSGVRGGLIGIMNEQAKKYAKDNNFQFADQYELIFAPEAAAIRDSVITKGGNKTNKSATPLQRPVSQDTKSASPDSNTMETTVRNRSFNAGTQIISAIEQICRQSDYIAGQAGVKVSETENKYEPNPAGQTKNVNWFYVESFCTPIDYDNRRNDYAYKMTYRVNTYRLSNLFSPFYAIPHFPGIHKKYPYWFTGQNTSVIQYEADFNKNFFFQITGETPSELQKAQEVAIRSMLHMLPMQAAAASGESRQGAEGRANEITASAADYLYSVASNNKVKMRIIGDPAWLAQGEYSGFVSSTKKDAFLPDGTINFAEGQILFEIVWQRPGPRDLTTGLQDPYAAQRPKDQFGQPIQSVVYMAVTVTSFFRGGKFEQELDGSFYPFPKPDKSNAVVKSPTPEQTPRPGDSQTEQQLTAREDARENALAALLLPGPGGAVPEPAVSLQPPQGETGVDAGGNNVGVLLRDETGQVSTLRINPETGELYNAAGLPAPPRAPSATQQANQDALARYIKEIGSQDPEFVDPTRIPNPPAPDVYGQVMNRET